MAAKDRQTSSYVSFVKQAAETPRKFNLFALVRGASARSKNKPRVGASRQPEQDVVNLRQIPHVHYPAPTLNDIRLEEGKVVADGYWLGLTGPMSPLPLHLTEFAVYERRYAAKQPFSDFLDLLAGRFLQLFYRAWADSKPHVMADRPEDDKFAKYIAHLSGAGEGTSKSSAFSEKARLHYAPLFVSRRSAAAIEGGLSHLLGMGVKIVEFIPTWQHIEKEDCTRLGQKHNRIGEAVLGNKLLQVSDFFEVQITAKNMHEFKELLPSGKLFPVVAEALTAFAPSHLEWKITLCLPPSDVPDMRLNGTSQLGWSSWLGKAANDTVRQDVHIGRNASERIAS